MMMRLFPAVFCAVSCFLVCGGELTVFDGGNLNGKLASKAEIRNGSLRFRTSDAIKLKLVPPKPDLTGYTQLEITYTANRAGDKFRFTMTSNPPGADKWNYFAAPGQITIAKGKQKTVIDLVNLSRSRQPLGKDQIQTLDFNFTGWGMPYKKGLVLDIEKIVLTDKAPAPEKSAAGKKKALISDNRLLMLLPDKPWIPVPGIADRKFWDPKRNTVYGKNTLKHAARALKTPAAPPPTDYYLDFLRNGNRSRYEQAYAPLIRNYSYLTMALCLTGDTGTYFKHWEAYNNMLCSMATWVYPAHDSKLDNLLMRCPHIELVGSQVGVLVSTARHLLSPLLSRETVSAMEKAVNRQLVTPFIETVQKKRRPDWFLVSTNNWNAVCIANVVQILLASDLPADLRRTAIAFALEHSANYLKGFTSDGYCSEGISYWSYGFGHYLRLAATLHAASGSRINLLSAPAVRQAAAFPERFMFSNDNSFPAFSDCSFDAGIGDAVIYLRDRLMGHPAGSTERIASDMLYQLAVYGLTPQKESKAKSFSPERISAFPETGVFVIRHPEKDGILLACKGGSNDELHNHNDVGSYAAAFAGKPAILGDLGGTVYTRDSFNSNRYQNPLLNSWGHPVPVPGGKLQNSGPGTEAKVLRFEKNKDHAAITLDIRKAYRENEAIEKLERSFDYSFAGRGRIIITDTAKFSEPQTFESALTTFGSIRQTAKDKLLVQYRNSKVEISVDTNGVPWKLTGEIIKAETRWKDVPRRYAIVLDGKHKTAKIKITITPTDK